MPQDPWMIFQMYFVSLDHPVLMYLISCTSYSKMLLFSFKSGDLYLIAMQAQGGLLVVPFSRERGTSLPGEQSFPWKKTQKLFTRIK